MKTQTVEKYTPASLVELAGLFLKLGVTGFGGPAAHIAMMQNEVVAKRNWLNDQEFLDRVGAASFLPGPNSTEVAMYIGYHRHGLKGLVVAGVSFILPAAIIVSIIAFFYVHFQRITFIEDALYGIKPVMVTIILQALFAFKKIAIKNKKSYAILAFAFALSIAGVNPLLVLAASGCISFLLHPNTDQKMFGLSAGGIGSTLSIAGLYKFNLFSLFFFFLKIGSILFGSGYVLFAFLRNDLVENFKWMSESQLLDAAAIGQFTPGPVFTAATFIGYLLSGPSGAVVATVAIFLPAFIFVAISAPHLSKIRNSSLIASILDGINIASLALMAVVVYQFTRSAVLDSITAFIAGVSIICLFKLRLNSTWLIIAGALVGILIPHSF